MQPGSNEMEVLRVEVAAPATSFRYPHFLIGKQVTYEMPPPSTIYGHVASALGELPDPNSFRFGYHFRTGGRSADLEHQHVITAGGAPFEDDGRKYRTSVQATVQPHLREFLFRPVLTLYLDRPDWLNAFRFPTFCVILGRSQDLATITRCERVTLRRQDAAYFEHTLLPFSLRPHLGIGSTITMARHVENTANRRANFERYIVLRERAFAGPGDGAVSSSQRILDPPPGGFWVDEDVPKDRGSACSRF